MELTRDPSSTARTTAASPCRPLTGHRPKGHLMTLAAITAVHQPARAGPGSARPSPPSGPSSSPCARRSGPCSSPSPGTVLVTLPVHQRRAPPRAPGWYQGFDPTNAVAGRARPRLARHRRPRRAVHDRRVRQRAPSAPRWRPRPGAPCFFAAKAIVVGHLRPRASGGAQLPVASSWARPSSPARPPRRRSATRACCGPCVESGAFLALLALFGLGIGADHPPQCRRHRGLRRDARCCSRSSCTTSPGTRPIHARDASSPTPWPPSCPSPATCLGHDRASC